MKMKKVLSLMLATALVVSMAGCGGSGSETKSDSNETVTDSNETQEPASDEADTADDGAESGGDATGMPLTEEPVTLTVLTTRWGNMGDSFTNNEFLKQLEEESNVHIEWQVQSLNDWSEQKGIMLAGGSFRILFSETRLLTMQIS